MCTFLKLAEIVVEKSTQIGKPLSHQPGNTDQEDIEQDVKCEFNSVQRQRLDIKDYALTLDLRAIVPQGR